MKWNVAQAKQRLSELLRKAAREPQVIAHRGRAVAAVVATDLFEEFEGWRAQRRQASLGDAFAELRQLCTEERYRLAIPRRRNRREEFAETLRRVSV